MRVENDEAKVNDSSVACAISVNFCLITIKCLHKHVVLDLMQQITIKRCEYMENNRKLINAQKVKQRPDFSLPLFF